MKLFSIFMLVFTLGTYASGYSQKQLVTLDLKQCDVNTLFQEIWKQTGLRFVYNEKDIAGLNRLDIKANQQAVDEVLDNLFRNTPYQCTMESDVIYVTPRPEANNPQAKKEMVKLTGNVTDKKGNPLPGVTVFIGNSSIGTSTDINGNYQLGIVKGSAVEIVYTFIGMKKATYQFPALEDSIHNVILEDDNVELDDVVVIGYGTKSKRNVTSSVSSVSSEDMEKFNNGTTTFDNLLGGAIKGVLVQQSSGKPGSASTINVRGITSPVSGSTNEPLYVIDGVPFFLTKDSDGLNPLLTISPNDIESIDVLKDAAATSIYGSRGANGVIIVNTKNGRRNQKVRINAGYTLSVGNPVKKYRPLNRSEFMSHQDLIIRNTVNAMNNGEVSLGNYSFSPGFGDEMMTGATNLGPYWDYDANYNPSGVHYDGLNEDAFGTADTDWVKETQNKNAITHQYNVGMRGGSEKTNYSFSFNAVNQDGSYINEKLERYGARLSLDSDISNRFKAGGSLNYTYSKRKLGNDLSYMGFTQEWLFRPDVPVKNEDGSWGTGDGSLIFYTPSKLANPVAARYKQNQNKSSQFMGSSYLEYKILDGLKIRGDINLSVFNDHSSMFYPTYSTDDLYSAMGIDPEANLTDSHSQLANSSINFRADYELIKDKHHANFMLGYAWDRTFNEYSSNTYFGFPDDYILTNISSAARADYYSGGDNTSGLNSVYARASYNYDEKYLAEVNFRSDASSKFGPGNKRGYFPALSLGWRLTKEDFMKKVSYLNDLKLRFSVGQTGSTNVDDFIYRQFFTRSSSVNYGGLPGVIPSSTFPNQDVKWEMTTEYNGGIDFSLFDYRLFGSIDAYYRYTDGALSPSPLPYETGVITFYSNLMDLSNRGFEFEIGGHIIQNDQVSWTSKFNLSFNRNRVESLNNANLNSIQLEAYVEGKPAGVRQGYIVEKIFQDEAEVALLNQKAKAANPNVDFYQNASTGPGDYKYKDLNGDGVINSEDKTIIASPEPKFFGGFFNSVNYKNFNLSLVFQFSKGTKSFLDQLTTDAYGILGQSIYREMYGNTWTPENTNARYARVVNGDPSQNSQRISDRYVFNTSYLRLKNISLSYNIPQNVLKKINVQSAMVFATVSNIWTLTKWPGLDPEVLNTSRGMAGYTSNNDPYPLSKSFSVGVKLEF